MIQLNLEQCVFTACLWEATARKAGNVHRYADFPGLTYLDFIQSAHAISPAIADRVDAPIGETVLECIKATRKVVSTNTNLGIVLLLAPLSKTTDYRVESISALIHRTTVEDAEKVYEAIRLAVPGGLGEVKEQDISQKPTQTLFEVMQLAADRDSIARQYANGFRDIFEVGFRAYEDAHSRAVGRERGILEIQLAFLTAFPDSLIARKKGWATAVEVQNRSRQILPFRSLSGYKELDAHLRSDGHKLNPGTTADLVTASLFVWLRTNKIDPTAPFAWTEYDK